jgi:folate-dependent phosphoribosylglycinamide formyltransferase PurN
MRLVLITSGTEYARRITLTLSLGGTVIDTLLLVHPPQLPSCARFQAVMRDILYPRRLMSRFGRLLLSAGGQGRPNDDGTSHEGLCHEIVDGGEINSEFMLQTLRVARPDYLLLGGLGILSDAALQIPARGTVNVHPALLPWIRGTGVVARSIEREVAIGVTAHFVNAGIDTGDIIQRRLVPITDVDTLESATSKAGELCVEVMVNIVSSLLEGKSLDRLAQTLRYPYCRYPSPAEKAALAKRVRDGYAKALYCRWREFYGSDVLMPDNTDHPPIAVSPLS